MAGDYNQYQRHYQRLTTDLALSAIQASYLSVLPVRNASYGIFIQKAELVITTFVASVVTLVGHTTGNVYARFDVPATPNTSGVEPYTIDYGPTGLAVTAGENVDVSLSQVGVVGYLHIEAYQKYALTGTLNAQSGLQ